MPRRLADDSSMESWILRRVQDQRPHPLGPGLLAHEHQPHIGVMGDGDARERPCPSSEVQIGALHARLRELQRVEVAGRQGGDGLRAPTIIRACSITMEHLGDAVVDLADEVADGWHRALSPKVTSQVAEDLEAHLLLDVGDVDAVALAQLTGFPVGDLVLRDDEQGLSPLVPGPAPSGTGEDEVHDVLRACPSRRW